MSAIRAWRLRWRLHDHQDRRVAYFLKPGLLEHLGQCGEHLLTHADLPRQTIFLELQVWSDPRAVIRPKELTHLIFGRAKFLSRLENAVLAEFSLEPSL